MSILVLAILAYVFTGAVAIISMWVTLRLRARRGLISRVDPRLERLEIEMAICFFTWPRAVWFIADYKPDYRKPPYMPPTDHIL